MARFSKRHYEAIAATMRSTYPDASDHPNRTPLTDQWLWDCQHLAQLFAQDNPRFDYDRFITACRPANVATLPRINAVRA